MSADAAVADMRAEVQEHWWLPLVQGIAAIVLGILLLTYTGATSAILAGFIGFYWLIQGVVNLISMFVDHTMWGWKLFIGGLFIAAWSTYAFETSVCYTSELRDPKKDTVKAIASSGLLCVFVFMIVPISFQGVLGVDGLLEPLGHGVVILSHRQAEGQHEYGTHQDRCP